MALISNARNAWKLLSVKYAAFVAMVPDQNIVTGKRSEERRVGKEC